MLPCLRILSNNSYVDFLLYLLVIVFYFKFSSLPLEAEFPSSRPALNSFCSLGWLPTHGNPPVSASEVLDYRLASTMFNQGFVVLLFTFISICHFFIFKRIKNNKSNAEFQSKMTGNQQQLLYCIMLSSKQLLRLPDIGMKNRSNSISTTVPFKELIM